EKCLTQVASADPQKTATCESIKQWGYCYPECPRHDWSLQEVIEAELKGVSIELHPYIDYHIETGLTVGAYSAKSKKLIIIINKDVKMVDSRTLLLEEALPTPISLKKPNPVGISKKTLEDIIRVAEQLGKGINFTEEDRKSLANSLLGKLRFYFYHSDGRWHLAIACWAIATYYHRLFPIMGPFIFQGVRGSGKGTIELLLVRICWNPTEPQSGLRNAPLFRSIEESRGTIFIDVTRISTKDSDLLDIMEAIEQDQIVRRCVGEKNDLVSFHVSCPKTLALRETPPFIHKCILCITETASRSSPYTKRRGQIKSDTELDHIRFETLRSAVFLWQQVLAEYEALDQDEKLFGRRFDLWRPLLAICKVYYPDKYSELLDLAREDAENAEKGDIMSDVEDLLLSYFLRTEFEKSQSMIFSLKDLTEDAQIQLGEKVVKSYHKVQSALMNLHVIKKRMSHSVPAKYQIDLSKARVLAAERGIIQVVETSDTKKNLTAQGEQAQPVGIRKVFKFCALPQTIFGICAYCGKGKTLVFRDDSGSLLCLECKNEAERSL
ncbi:MAG TPA: hypothetical protein VJ574_04200, partial [Candidatus Bathyarchaeia archaeon]|nr:hypothetical protein [Candidatus Bathyarchaeia archaeon]